MSTKPRQSQNPNPIPNPGRPFGSVNAGPWEDRTPDLLRAGPQTPVAPPPKMNKFKKRKK